MPQLYLNNFQTQFIADVRAAPQTGAPASELDYGVLRVSDGAAGTLLNPPAGGWYVLTAYKRSGSLETDYEILRVTAVDNSVIGECRLTVLRGQEGTAPRAYLAGDLLEMRMTAGGMREVVQSTDARLADARPPTGAAGGVLAGQYPAPTFAQPMATAADLQSKVDKVAGKGLSTNDFTSDLADKLAGVATGATKNMTDAQLRDRSTHTGEQAIGTVTGLQTALDGAVKKSGDKMTGGLNFVGSGLKLTADFSNPTPANRMLIQTNTENGGTVVGITPNGTATSAHLRLYGNADTTNATYLGVRSAGNADVRLESAFEGAGSYAPMVFYTGGAERMRIATDGKVGVGTSNPTMLFTVANFSMSGGAPLTSGSGTDPNCGARLQGGSVALDFGTYLRGDSWIQSRLFSDYASNFPIHLNPNGGAVLVGNGGLGYGPGAGGTVVQATSKSTDVTINKPTGRIVTHGGAIAANGTVGFNVLNSLVNPNDVVTLTGVITGDANPAQYLIRVSWVSIGAFNIAITNMTGGNLAEIITLNFLVIKGVSS